MWDQKTGLNISAHEGSERLIDRAAGANHPSIQDKKIFESSGEDSGFISGPQNLYSSESFDTHYSSGIDRSTGSNPSVQDKNTFESSGHDSGYISGPQIHHSSESEDKEDNHKDNTKDSQTGQMLLDNGVSGVTEWFCDLSINSSSPVNNLNNCRQELSSCREVPNTLLHDPVRPLKLDEVTEICYFQDQDGDTQLHLAILGKYVQAVWAIIRLAPVPAFLDLRNDDAHAPLHLAVLTRQPEIVRHLLLAGAKATIQDKEGNTPLHLACMNSDKACVDALTRPVTDEEQRQHYNFSGRIPQVLPTDLEQRNYHGLHYVHIAAQRNDIEILKHLVLLGADINAREGKSGYTALHFACENSNEQLAQFLLNKCRTQLNVETCTYGLLTAYQLAAEQKNRDLMDDLKRYGAETLSPPESDDDSYLDSSDEDFQKYESDDCELN